MNRRKLAAIDIGTNSFHLIVAGINQRGNFEIIDREKEVIRLGEGSSDDIKFISEPAIERAINTLNSFRGIAESHEAEIRAVATSAVREAKNKNQFIEKVLKETGIEIEVVSGQEEARLIYLGILKAVPVFNKKVCCIDIGGGSTELIVGEKGSVLCGTSLKLGAVRLTQKFFPDFKLTESRIDKCREWINGEIFRVIKEIENEGFDLAIGTSGTIMSTGLMISANENGEFNENTILNNYQFSYSDFQSIEKMILKKTTFAERKKIKGLDSKRADIIPAGILILSEIMSNLKLKKIKISGYALREGILIDSMQKSNGKTALPNLHNIRFESVKHLMDSCDYAKDHCKHVAELALGLYDKLKHFHKLDDECREYLHAAALLHDIGYHISHTQHHRHSLYMIQNSELLGFNENEIRIIANVARYHRKSHPKGRHLDYSILPEKSKKIIQKLSAILRIADSFDRTHSEIVKDIEIKLQPGQMEFNLLTDGVPADIEIWNFDRRKELFEEIFGIKTVARVNIPN
ncbi:MAG: Ppx/GppA phosphatase family protein [Ignavibacteria bacterium]|jgi:exopolyphosphatase/guanosine-5'-triphosphate,3'-diphosphate pyrophosphatase